MKQEPRNAKELTMEKKNPEPIGNRRELFVDPWLVDTMEDCRLVMHAPREEEKVLSFDRPWEGVASGSETLIDDGERFRLFYRGMPDVKDGDPQECTCMALSKDGIHWERPDLGQFEVHGSKHNNIVLAHQPPFSHNFMPFLDKRPAVPDGERFKAVAGLRRGGGLFAFVSSDGVTWEKRSDAPILTHAEGHAFDSPNLAFWSANEACYVCYYRTWRNVGPEQNVRWVTRAVSDDFVHWSPGVEMEMLHDDAPAPPEEIYTTGTHPYCRAPQLYIAMPRRFMKKRTILSDQEAEALGVVPSQRDSCSDTILLSSRGGSRYDRTFMEAFLRPGADRLNWSSRAGTVAAGVIQTGPRELSLYRNEHYGSPSAHLKRFSLRLDGFASLNAGHGGGRLTTRPLTFDGSRLEMNYATSAAGHVRVGICETDGKPLPGYATEDCRILIGDEIDRTVSWTGGESLADLAGRPLRLVFELKDADVFSFRTL